MKICHVCAAECEDSAELCPVCGAELISGETEESAEEIEIVIENPVLAASVEDVVTAEIYRDILKENGIPFSSGETEPDSSMKLIFGGGFVAEDIFVDESNLERAQQLYEEVLNSEPEFDEYEFEDSDSGADGENEE